LNPFPHCAPLRQAASGPSGSWSSLRAPRMARRQTVTSRRAELQTATAKTESLAARSVERRERNALPRRPNDRKYAQTRRAARGVSPASAAGPLTAAEDGAGGGGGGGSQFGGAPPHHSRSAATGDVTVWTNHATTESTHGAEAMAEATVTAAGPRPNPKVTAQSSAALIRARLA